MALQYADVFLLPQRTFVDLAHTHTHFQLPDGYVWSSSRQLIDEMALLNVQRIDNYVGLIRQRRLGWLLAWFIFSTNLSISLSLSLCVCFKIEMRCDECTHIQHTYAHTHAHSFTDFMCGSVRLNSASKLASKRTPLEIVPAHIFRALRRTRCSNWRRGLLMRIYCDV